MVSPGRCSPGRSTVEDRRPRNSCHRACYVFAARAVSACHWSWSAVGDDQRPTEGDCRLRGTREPRLSSFACIHTLPVLGTSLFVYCLFILFTNPHPESDTISQEKHKYKTAVWIKWPTQGALKTQVRKMQVQCKPSAR